MSLLQPSKSSGKLEIVTTIVFEQQTFKLSKTIAFFGMLVSPFIITKLTEYYYVDFLMSAQK